MEEISNNLTECHVFILPSQGSIYSMCRLPTINKSNPVKILAASLKRPVYLLEFVHGVRKPLAPRSSELTFTYLQGQAEIISIDAFLKAPSFNTLIGVTYVKNVNADSTKFLNIYTLRESGSEISLDGLTFSCTVELSFMPYQLFHGLVGEKSYFFLSGSDYKIHAYREDSSHIVKECTVNKTFPEFSREFPSVVLRTKFHYMSDGFRLTALGCECGALILCVTDTRTNTINSEFMTDNGCSVTSLNFFYSDGILQLLVTFSVLPAIIYRNVISKGFTDHVVLRGSDEFDVTTCSLVCNFHMDHKPTIFLGNYGQELLVYRPEEETWTLKWQKSFSHPILALDYCDVTGDGVKELVAMTTRGVHVFQHDLEEVARLLVHRLKTREQTDV